MEITTRIAGLFGRRHEERNLAVPFNQAGQFIPPPGFGGLFGGLFTTAEMAYGLSSVSSAIRVIGDTVATLPLLVYEGREADKRLALDSWQYALLAESDDPTPFDLKTDVATSIESCGNAFVRKVKVGGQVVQLLPLDPDYVWMKRDKATGDKIFEIREDGVVKRYGTDEIIHVRGPVMKGGQLSGYDPMTLHRTTLGTAVAQEQFVGRFFANDARPGTLLVFPQGVTREQGREWIESWNANHQGFWNSHKTAVMGGGAEVKTIPVSMDDAQMTQAREHTSKQIAEIFRIPVAMLTGDFANQRQTSEQEMLNFYNVSLLPRLVRIEDALRADRDLFPLGSGLSPEFDTSEFLRTDAATQADIDHQEVQSGLKTRNEVRARRGLPNLPPNPSDPSQSPGDVVPELPVGAGPNVAGAAALRRPLALPAANDTAN